MDSSSNKWKDDFQKGKENSEIVIRNLNKYFQKTKSGYQIQRVHQQLKTMKIQEKVKNNSLKNRLFEEAPFTKAMGLDCHIVEETTEKSLPLFIRYLDDFGFYIKLPKEVKSPEQIELYLRIISDYYVLFVYRQDGVILERYNGPTALKNIVGHCPYHLCESKGNRNRLQFDYNLSKLVYSAPEEKSFFTGTLTERIKEVML